MVYFAADMEKANKHDCSFYEIGSYLHYYILYNEDKDILHMDLRDLDLIPLTEKEAKSFAFCLSEGKGYVKIHESSWEDFLFDRERGDVDESDYKQRIKYVITRQDEKDCVSLMHKIIEHKIKVFIENRKIFEKNNQEHWSNIEKKYLDMLENTTTIKEVSDFYTLFQKDLLQEL